METVMSTNLPKAFPSRFGGQTCATCQNKINKGDMIRWSRKTKGTVWHEGCYENRPEEQKSETASEHVSANDAMTETEHEIFINTPKAVATTQQDNGLAQTLANALSQYLPNGTVDEKQVIALIKANTLDMDEITELVKAYAPTPKVITVEVKNETGEVKDLGIQHKQFPTLLTACSAITPDGYHLNVWLTGPAGSGKTTGAKNVAKGLGLPFYATGAISQSFQLLGFMNAMGNYVTTDFRRAYEHGGVMLLDETDASSNEGVLALNQALANGECAFPDAMISRHKNFVCIAAANTWGLGATNDYVGRAKLDAAFLDRFVSLDWPIDEDLETATAGNAVWSKRVQSVRARVRDKGLKVVVSPRASYFGASLLSSGMDRDMVDALTLRKGMTADQWQGVK